MSKRAVILSSAAAVVVIALIALGVFLSRHRVQRRPLFRQTPTLAARRIPKTVPPVAQWSDYFETLEARGDWDDLDSALDDIEKHHPDRYAQWSLAYLHARARLENNDAGGAAQKLRPYLTAGNPFRDLALFHQAEIEEARNDQAAASSARMALIIDYPSSLYREQAIDAEIELLGAAKDPRPLMAFASKLYASSSTARRRDFDTHTVESLLLAGDSANALTRGLTLLRGGTMDDPADRTSVALDKPQLTKRMPAEQLAMLGSAMQNHRHFDRAVALLSAALPGLPQKRDDLLFDIGRAWFGDEKYPQALQTYLRGANETRDPKKKAQFLFHASRAAQLTGDDAGAERLMTAVIALPVRTPDTSAALTQRMRTRLKQKRISEAVADLSQIRKIAPASHDLVDASLAFAEAMVAYGNTNGAIATLNSIPPKLLSKFDRPELEYWRGRALEARDPHAAFNAYLAVLRATVPTHFAYFARDRVNAPAMATKLANEIAARDAQIAQLIAARNWVLAKAAATDRILLSTVDRSQSLQRLVSVYEQLPPYRAVLDLHPDPLPRFPPGPNPDRATLLMAMGLFDEAADVIPKRWPLRPLSSALTQSLALNRGAVSKPSIYAIEVLMKSVPDDYVPDLLPMVVRKLLYPRYFYGYIVDDSKAFDADPTLVLAIMREESRFDPRAKSEAAARGLLQFIITTATDIGRDIGLVQITPDDLYDPRVIVRLGAKYIGTLLKKFGGDHYQTAGAYNAGPNQVALWARLAPAPGDDFFLSEINFDETKDYVRKVMNSYRRYGEIYGNAGPVGGLRAEP